MLLCPICNECLVRTDGQVEQLLSSLFHEKSEPQILGIVQLFRGIPALEPEVEYISDDSEDENDSSGDSEAEEDQPVHFLPVQTRRVRDRMFANRRPVEFKETLRLYFSKMVVTTCGHMFHYSCCQEWYKIRRHHGPPSCPYCRSSCLPADVREIYPSTSAEGRGLVRLGLRALPIFEPARKWWQRFLAGSNRAREEHCCVTGVEYPMAPPRRSWGMRAWCRDCVGHPVTRLGFPISIIGLLLHRLMVLGELTSHNYQMDDPTDPIELEMYAEGGEYLGVAFAYLAFLSLSFALILDITYYCIEKCLNYD